jgi:hypothetical protein
VFSRLIWGLAEVLNMFKFGSFEDEIYRSMERTLVDSQQVENTHGLSKLAKAVDYLNSAASIFEKAGMDEEAEEVTEILQRLAQEMGNSK